MTRQKAREQVQIVIDIDKEDWKDINNTHFIREDLKFKIGKAIMNGTPLPKNHGRLIDGDRVVTGQIYDDEYEEITEKRMSIIDDLNAYTDEGVMETDIILQAESEEV